MRLLRFVLFGCLVAAVAFAQSDRGTITGTVSDPAGAVVPGAAVVAVHVATGARYETVTTPTGNYTVLSLPVGMYTVSVDSPGFKKYIQQGITVQVDETARIDVALQVGAASDSVTVNADATLLKTENSEQSTTISRESLLELPVNFSVTAGGGILNPLEFVDLAPGGWINNATTTTNVVRVNGQPNSSYKLMVDGQDATSGNNNTVSGYNPAVEAVEEFTLQTSNFSAEFGQVSGGLFNFTSRSGTNRLHGSFYEYFANDALNAGVPYTNDGRGDLIKPAVRKNDVGFSVGGPVFIPKVYNGHNRTFFFVSVERYFDRKRTSGVSTTVPTAAMRNGDFSAVLTGRTLGTDPLGRPIMENTIYDPNTARTVSGQTVTDPFQNNTIPASRLDPVAMKIQALIPAPTNAGLVNNLALDYPFPRDQFVPSVKIDHNFTADAKLSGYYEHYGSHDLSSPDGLPVPISSGRNKHAYSYTERINFDQSVSPTLLLHAGAGEQRYLNPDCAPPSVLHYDAQGMLGVKGGVIDGFPVITGLSSSFGGMALTMGPATCNFSYTDKWTAVFSATRVAGKHTYKAGGEWQLDPYSAVGSQGATGNYGFSGSQTGLPSTQGQSLSGGAVGFAYASFLLGAVNSGSINPPFDPQFRRKSLSLFLQDNWKATRKLTLDYGLRWDYAGQGHEIHNRWSEFGPTTPNPSAGGLPGGTIYAGSGPGRCNCEFANTYPYAIGPRLGVAYQITPKTVFRAGWGLIYGQVAQYNYIGQSAILGVGQNTLTFSNPAFGGAALFLRNGLQYNPADLYSVTLDPGIRPSAGQINSPTYWIDRNGGRPPRTNQWNIALQREITPNLVLEAAYVGNRSVWLESDSLDNLNGLSAGRLATFGLDINNAANRTLLTSTLGSPMVQAAGFKAPYAGFPTTLTLAQALRPYPQFGTVPVLWAPLGKEWYDSLQMKLTKRYSHGLAVTSSFTWSKNLALGSDAGATNNVYNLQNDKSISTFDMPLVLAVGFNYRIPAPVTNHMLKSALSDWTFGGIVRYASGLPIPVPASQNALSSLTFQNTLANRVPGQPLFLKNLNCGCIDPNQDFVLNPNAWSQPAAGQWGTAAAFYSDYRYQRRPEEQISLGRTFRIREHLSFQLRGEFFNIFNRVEMNNPTATNSLATPTRTPQGQPTSGFGYISTASTFSGPRNGQLVGRIQW